jgi:hypothetical protein
VLASVQDLDLAKTKIKIKRLLSVSRTAMLKQRWVRRSQESSVIKSEEFKCSTKQKHGSFDWWSRVH